jgi:splicing factor 3B subunit 2
LYRVLPEAQKKKGFLGSTGYDISQPTLDEDIATNVISPGSLARLIGQKRGVDVALDPSQLENLTKADLNALHDKEQVRQMAAKRSYNQVEDMSDMVAEHAAQQAKKHKGQEEKKKSKFKF